MARSDKIRLPPRPVTRCHSKQMRPSRTKPGVSSNNIYTGNRNPWLWIIEKPWASLGMSHCSPWISPTRPLTFMIQTLRRTRARLPSLVGQIRSRSLRSHRSTSASCRRCLDLVFSGESWKRYVQEPPTYIPSQHQSPLLTCKQVALTPPSAPYTTASLAS